MPHRVGSADYAEAPPKICYEAARLLDVLLRDDQTHRIMVKSGVLSPLFQLATGGIPETRSFAIRALISLATTSDDRAAAIQRSMSDVGCFEAIAKQLSDTNPDVVALAAQAVGSLCRHGGHPMQSMLQLGAVAALTNIIREHARHELTGPAHARGAAHAVSALASLGGQRLVDATSPGEC
jgi:hypothetical protein